MAILKWFDKYDRYSRFEYMEGGFIMEGFMEDLWIEDVEQEEATEKHYSNGCWGADGGYC